MFDPDTGETLTTGSYPTGKSFLNATVKQFTKVYADTIISKMLGRLERIPSPDRTRSTTKSLGS